MPPAHFFDAPGKIPACQGSNLHASAWVPAGDGFEAGAASAQQGGAGTFVVLPPPARAASGGEGQGWRVVPLGEMRTSLLKESPAPPRRPPPRSGSARVGPPR